MLERVHRHTAEAAHDYLPACGHDALLPTYDVLGRLLGVPSLHRLLLDLAGLSGLSEGARVLEVGCGTGNLTIMAKRLHPDLDVVGVDPDPLALARAVRKARGLSISFDQGYAQSLPYPDASFDRVLSALMLHHLDGEARERMAQEVFRVLRPGGAVYLMDIGGRVDPADGLVARRALRSERLRDNLGDRIPQLLRDGGFAECVELTNRVRWHLGRVTYYRATRSLA